MEIGEATQVLSGTLNLVLANKSGFVIAADSRITDPKTGNYVDTCQKLFRTSPNSALSFAGFATALGNTPFEFEIPAVLRSRFGKSGISDGRGAPLFVEGWIEGLVIHLTKVAVILEGMGIPIDCPLIVSMAGFDSQSIPELRKITLLPVKRCCGAQGEDLPIFEVSQKKS